MLRLIILILTLGMPAVAQDAQRFSTRVPFTTQQQPPALQIYIAVNGQQVGPLDPAGFIGHLGTPEAAASTFVWMPGMTDWALASTVPSLQSIIASMGQSGGGEMTAPADPASFMLGVWVSETFDWTLKETKYNSIIQMKLLPDGRFEGATIFRDSAKLEGDIRVSHEKGTWSVTTAADGSFTFVRNIFYTDVVRGEVLASGQLEDQFVLKAVGPNNVISAEEIDFVRVPEGE